MCVDQRFPNFQVKEWTKPIEVEKSPLVISIMHGYLFEIWAEQQTDFKEPRNSSWQTVVLLVD